MAQDQLTSDRPPPKKWGPVDNVLRVIIVVCFVYGQWVKGDSISGKSVSPMAIMLFNIMLPVIGLAMLLLWVRRRPGRR